MEVLSCPSAYPYATNRRKGTHICRNSLWVTMRDAADAVLTTIEDALLNPTVATRALEYAEAAIVPRSSIDHEAVGRQLEGYLVDWRGLPDRTLAGSAGATASGQSALKFMSREDVRP